MRPEPATQAASHVDSCPALVTARRAVTALARQRSLGVPHLLKPVAAPCSCDHRPATAARGQQPCPAPGSGQRGGRNAQATRSRSRACWECPRRFHPREPPAAAGSAAIIRQLRNVTFLLNPLSATLLYPAIQKSPDAVQNLWTISPRCGRTWKNRGELRRASRRGGGILAVQPLGLLGNSIGVLALYSRYDAPNRISSSRSSYTFRKKSNAGAKRKSIQSRKSAD